MHPFKISSQGNENMLAYTFDENRPFIVTSNNKRVKLKQMATEGIKQQCIHTSSPDDSNIIKSTLAKSTYKRLLAFQQYHEITKEQLAILNTCDQSLMELCQLVVGSLLFDDCKILLINRVECYDRDPARDAFVERTKSFEESSYPTLLSPYPSKLEISSRKHDNSTKHF
ncbi:unnamed protein product [Mucor fragilis]